MKSASTKHTFPHNKPSEKVDIKTMYDNFFSSQRPLFSLSERFWNPPTDIYETKDSIIIKIEIAGMRKEDISIALEGDLLVVSGTREEDVPIKKENIHLIEVHYGRFQRVFNLPPQLTLSHIVATYKDGFLKICMPKSESKKREVSIKIE